MKKAACCTRFHHVLPSQTPTTTTSSRWGSCGTEREMNSAARHPMFMFKTKEPRSSPVFTAMLCCTNLKWKGLSQAQWRWKANTLPSGPVSILIVWGLPSVMRHVGVLTAQAVMAYPTSTCATGRTSPKTRQSEMSSTAQTVPPSLPS